jgi:hypothetical protein
VYSRVIRDYGTRLSALEEQAGAIRERVGEDLRTLDALHDRCREAVDQARVELQEAEFRHEIGEFTREEFQQRQQVIERAIAERQDDFASVKKLRQRYVELLPAEAPGAPPTAVPAAAVRPAAPPAPAAAAPPTPFAAAPPPPPPPEPAPAEPLPEEEPIPPAEGATSFLAPPSNTEFEPPPLPGAADGEQFGTVAVTAAMLVEDRTGLPGDHHRLGVHTSIGRTADNQIVVPIREVSRRHAEIVLDEGGYLIRDLGSPNGTFVNGERVTEHRLDDGDRIALGGQVFVFKAR